MKPLQVVDTLIRKALKKASVLLCVCTHRNFNVDAMTQVMELFKQRKHDFTWFPLKGDALIDRARSRATSYFMKERNDDILLFVDDDVIFKTEDILKIVDNVMNGMDICGGLYMLKKPVVKIGSYIDKSVMFFDNQEVTFSKDSKPVEIMYVSSGFMAIHRKVFQSMIDKKIVPFCHPFDIKFWPFFQPFPKEVNGHWVYLSEDWAFCDRARNIGFKIWLNPSIFIEHVGEYSWSLADALRENKKKMDENFSISIS